MKTHTHIVRLLSFVLVLALGYVSIAQKAEAEKIDSDMESMVGELAIQDASVGEGVEPMPVDMAGRFDPAPAELRAAVKARSIEALKAAMAAKDKAWAQRDAALKARDEAFAQRDEAQNERDDAALASGEKIRELEALLAEKQDSLDKVQRAIAVKNAEITDLQMALSTVQSATSKDKFLLAYNLGCIYKAGRQYAKAEAEFLKALKYAPDDSAVHYNLGILYDDSLDDVGKARHHYQRFLDLAPTDSDAPKVVEWMSELQ